MYDKILFFFREHIIPDRIFAFFQPAYHRILAWKAALWYRFPSRKIKVIGITGTKGKSTTVELVSAIFEEAGYRTALSNTIRWKIGDKSHDNLFKMSMPGRFFIQGFLRQAVNDHCDVVVLEMTSQGALQYRHLFIDLDTFVLTNISPEHIEAHGSFEAYVGAKVSIARYLKHSKKRPRTIVTNADDALSPRFSSQEAEVKTSYGIKDVEPYTLGTSAVGKTKSTASGITFTLNGVSVHSPLSGLFNLYNILAAITTARAHGINDAIIIRAIEKFGGVKGRVERVEAGQDFNVIVDYAHTPDSLEKLYQVFEGSRNICVLGGTGGGRDSWKRTKMGQIAAAYCEDIILTNEDPYDEDPMQIIEQVKAGVETDTDSKATVILDRRLAIREAISRAKTGDTILITGKGTDPYIMGPRGTKEPWSDSKVAREELSKKFDKK